MIYLNLKLNIFKFNDLFKFQTEYIQILMIYLNPNLYTPEFLKLKKFPHNSI